MNNIKNSGRIIIKGLIYGVSVLSVFSLVGLVGSSLNNPGSFHLFEPGARVKTYLHVGKLLNDDYPDATLLAPEIGGLGYSFCGPILDAVGLASPAALKYHPMKIPEQRLNGAQGVIPPGYVREYMPDLIVTYDNFAQALLNDEIIHEYNLILIPAYLPEDAKYSESKTIWGSQYLRVYIHKDMAISESLLTFEQ